MRVIYFKFHSTATATLNVKCGKSRKGVELVKKVTTFNCNASTLLLKRCAYYKYEPLCKKS